MSCGFGSFPQFKCGSISAVAARPRAVPVACAARQDVRRSGRGLGLLAKLLSGVLVASLFPATAIAAGPIASSSFVGVEDPLSEGGAWAALTSLSPNGGRFQKNNGAFPDQLAPNHAGARTTAAVPADQYSEIVVGHVGSTSNNVGPIVRVQASGPSIDSNYLWWASQPNGVNGLYREQSGPRCCWCYRHARRRSRNIGQ